MNLGETLRAARERRGVTLEQASQDTRIRLKFLRALEAGDYQALPGATYTRGFLRNYGDYLDLDPDDLVALYHGEKGAPEPPQRLEPLRPITGRAVVLRPSIFVPMIVAAAVALFVGYLYWQFVSFAVPPRLEVTDPPADAIVQQAEFVLRGRTVPDGKLSVTVFPGPERYAGLRPNQDGTFAIAVRLRPGPNHVEIEVLDAVGKVNAVTRLIRYEATEITPGATPQAAQLIVDQPAPGATYTDGPVTVSGRVDPSVAALVVNGVPVRAEADGRFSTAILFEQGAQLVRVVARTAGGAEVQQERAVNVVYTRAVVQVQIRGGDAWLLAIVDGAQDGRTNRVQPNGTTLSFAGKEVRVRSGNAGATYLIVNGRNLGVMGKSGEVVERSFSLP